MLRTENINEYKIVNCGLTQITLDDDFNVPDAKADIDIIVKEWADVIIDEIKTGRDVSEKVGSDKVCVTGMMRFSILYVGKAEGDRCNPVRMEGRIPFSEWINLEGDERGEYYSCQAVIEDLNIREINSRKVSAKAIVTLKLLSENMQTLSMATGYDGDGEVLKLTDEVTFVQLSVNQKDNYRIRENVSVPQGKPEIQEIIWNDVDVRNFNARVGEGKINISGELDTFVMYMSSDENRPIQWYDTSIPFEGAVDASGCSPDMIPYIGYRIIGKNIEDRSDLDGENRDISVEVVLELDIKAYEEKRKDIVTDIYSPRKEVELVAKETNLKSICVRNNSNCRVSGTVTLEDCKELMQICNCTATVSIDESRICEEGIEAQGVVSANVVYITNKDEMPLGSVKTVIPFMHLIKTNGVSEGMEYNIQAYISSLSATINSAGLIEVKAGVALDVICFSNYSCQCLVDVRLSEATKEMNDGASIVGYFSDGTQTLWEVAKKFNTTPDLIREANTKYEESLKETELIPKGQKLLIMKYV